MEGIKGEREMKKIMIDNRNRNAKLIAFALVAVLLLIGTVGLASAAAAIGSATVGGSGKYTNWDISGTWDWTDSWEGGSSNAPMEIIQSGQSFSGTWTSGAGWYITGNIHGPNIEISGRQASGTLTFEGTYTLSSDGTTITGSWVQSDGPVGTTVAYRQAKTPAPAPTPAPAITKIPFVGNWEGVAWCANPSGKEFSFRFDVWIEEGVIMCSDHSASNEFRNCIFSDEGTRYKLQCPWYRSDPDKYGTYTFYIDKSAPDLMYGHEDPHGVSCKEYRFKDMRRQGSVETPTPTITKLKKCVGDEPYLYVGDRVMGKGKTIEIPIIMCNAKDLANMDLDWSYDASVLKLIDVTKGSLNKKALFEWNEVSPGKLKIAFASSKGVTGSGSIAVMKFEVIGNTGAKSTITGTVDTASKTDGSTISVGVNPGEVTVGTAPIKGDCDGDNKLTSRDALAALQISVQKRPFNICYDYNGDGKVNSTDARDILKAIVTGGK